MTDEERIAIAKEFNDTFAAANYATDGDRVLVDLKIEPQGGASGVPVELGVCQVWTINDAGKIVGYGVYPDRNRALALHYRGA
jgi:hypothetical protein